MKNYEKPFVEKLEFDYKIAITTSGETTPTVDPKDYQTGPDKTKTKGQDCKAPTYNP